MCLGLYYHLSTTTIIYPIFIDYMPTHRNAHHPKPYISSVLHVIFFVHGIGIGIGNGNGIGIGIGMDRPLAPLLGGPEVEPQSGAEPSLPTQPLRHLPLLEIFGKGSDDKQYIQYMQFMQLDRSI